MTNRVTLTIKSGSLEGQTYELLGGQEGVIGRAEDCTIRLTGGPGFCTVSRHHCVVEVGPNAVRVRDLGSCNGTRVNGMQIGRPRDWHLPTTLLAAPFRNVELHDGDELRVGDVLFAVAGSGTAEGKSPWEVDTPLGEEFAGCGGCAHGLAFQGSGARA